MLRQQLQRALEENERLKQEHAHLRQEIERLRRQLEEALRAAKRQAGPFSRGQPKPNPKPPGRKAGGEYGRHHCRPLPRRVDERIAVPLPARCPGCGGPAAFERTEPQYQEDILRHTMVRRFDVAVGRCCQCGRRVQGRHRLQTSDALGGGAGATGAGGAGASRTVEQTDGAVAGAPRPGAEAGLWSSGLPRGDLRGLSTEGPQRRTHLTGTHSRGARLAGAPQKDLKVSRTLQACKRTSG